MPHFHMLRGLLDFHFYKVYNQVFTNWFLSFIYWFLRGSVWIWAPCRWLEMLNLHSLNGSFPWEVPSLMHSNIQVIFFTVSAFGDSLGIFLYTDVMNFFSFIGLFISLWMVETSLFKCSIHISVNLFRSSEAKLCLTLWYRMDCSTPGFLVNTYSQSLLKLMSVEAVMPSNHLILCHSLLLLPSILPNIRVFSKESVLRIRWPKYWSFSFRI